MTIEKKLPNNPTDIMYIAMSTLQKCRPLLKEKDQGDCYDHRMATTLLSDSLRYLKASMLIG